MAEYKSVEETLRVSDNSNIVTRIKRDQLNVEGNRELIRIYEEKVKKVIERVWES